MREFKPGIIPDVTIRQLTKHVDERGWLTELWRDDQIDDANRPVMTYVSQTEPGIARGPHEHDAQADYFAFIGPGNFKIWLWDNRPDSETYNVYQTLVVGEDRPATVVVPAGVVHAYRNISAYAGIVINSPNALYRGVDYSRPVDEIRHEDDPASPFQIE